MTAGVHYEYVQSNPDEEMATVDLETAAEGSTRAALLTDEREYQTGDPAAGVEVDETEILETATALGSDSGTVRPLPVV